MFSHFFGLGSTHFTPFVAIFWGGPSFAVAKNLTWETCCCVGIGTRLFTMCRWNYMGVSENSGTLKSSILIGFSVIFTINFWGTPIFGNTHIHIFSFLNGMDTGHPQKTWICFLQVMFLRIRGTHGIHHHDWRPLGSCFFSVPTTPTSKSKKIKLAKHILDEFLSPPWSFFWLVRVKYSPENQHGP